MNKLILPLIFSLFFLTYLPHPASAWLDCPYGRINDPYPGKCGLYIDTNNNQLCDHSEATPTGTSQITTGKDTGKVTTARGQLIFWPIFLTITAYFCHWYLVFKTNIGKKVKWLNQIAFRFFWNLILLLSFLPTAISSLMVILDIKNTIIVSLHIQIGLIFIVVSIFHILTRLAYFKMVSKILTKLW